MERDVTIFLLKPPTGFHYFSIIMFTELISVFLSIKDFLFFCLPKQAFPRNSSKYAV